MVIKMLNTILKRREGTFSREEAAACEVRGLIICIIKGITFGNENHDKCKRRPDRLEGR